ncbi:GIY-YIG nuclease family protein [Photobacterium halotolerans]|uniref:GIY-YIG nuclease family protein n=1 Tax=Photobacterium halotolerans TaxID=265726 RepID=UPI00055F1E75|nr:GIY-YIG nuclease family protein [Photobacterium halotolerans]
MNKRDPAPIWSVYLIRTRCNRLYCGVTTDVFRRLSEHQSGKKGARFLKGKGPLTLAWCSRVGDKRNAMQLEYKIKQLPKSTKEALAAEQIAIAELFPDYFVGSL